MFHLEGKQLYHFLISLLYEERISSPILKEFLALLHSERPKLWSFGHSECTRVKFFILKNKQSHEDVSYVRMEVRCVPSLIRKEDFLLDRAPDKREYLIRIFLISHGNYML